MAAGAKTDTLPPPAPPDKQYRPFQVEAITLARSRPNLLLADSMGLGKSIESIGVINDNPEIRKILIICPASLIFNWRFELINWVARRNMTLGIATTKRWPQSDIIIVSYDSLKPLHRNIHSTEWDLLIVDEAHYAKNPNANRTMEIFGRESKEPAKRRPRLEAGHKLLLTGTPIVNRPAELFPLVHYLAPDEFPDRRAFINEFCGGKSKGQKKSEIGEKNLHQLHKRLTETVMIRRRKEDVLPELPPKIRQVIVMPGGRVQGAINLEKKLYADIQKGLSIIRMKAELAKTVRNDEVYKAAVQELRRAEFVTIQQITKLRMQTAMAKIPLVVDHVNNVLQHVNKVVIFAHHTAVIENIALEYGEAVLTIHGKKMPAKRQELIDLFQSNHQYRVLVAAMRASGLGHNLTAAQVCCFAEQDWTPSVLNQAEDRLHRIGASGVVIAQHLVLDGTIDAMVIDRIVEKQETITAALDPEVEVLESLYSLSRAKPFVEEDRNAIMKMAAELTQDTINRIHSMLEQFVARGTRGKMSLLDFNIMSILARESYLEAAQAALGLALLKKHGRN